MAVTRYVHTAFWNDSFNLSLTPEEKYFFLYFLTNPHSRQCGVYELPRRTIEFETGWAMAQLKPWLDRLPSHTHQLSGQTHIVSFHVPFTAAQFLAQAVQAQMPVRYFRDITASTRRLFVRD